MQELRVLIFSVDIGSGHKMAGQAIVAALEQQGPVKAKWVECLDYMGRDGGQFGRDTYFKALERAPGLWGAMYEERDAYKFFRPFSEFIDGLRVGDLQPQVRAFRPDLMIAVHPFGCGFGSALKRWGERVPLAAVLTDFDAHPGWIANGVDRYYCATSTLANLLLREGLPTGIAVSTGIPLRRAFWADAPRTRTRRALGLSAELPVVLLLGGGMGLGPIEEAVRKLGNQAEPCQVVLITGRNEELRSRAEAIAKTTKHELIVRGLVDNMHDYMGVADLAVGKPGGLTSSELLALGVPLVCLAPIPGQEQANATQLKRAGAAIEARNASDASARVTALLRDAERLRSMSDAAWTLGKPDAAPTIATKLRELVREGPCGVRPPRVTRAVSRAGRELTDAAGQVRRGVDRASVQLERGLNDALDVAEDLAKGVEGAVGNLLNKFKL